jgi:hypothetical protein
MQKFKNFIGLDKPADPKAPKEKKNYARYVFSGESQQVEKALKFVQDMFTNVDMHVVQLMLSKPLPDSIIKEL